MIIRQPSDGEVIVINQTDHSRFVGQLAAHWGNDSVPGPHPWESVVRAAIYHDYGWITYETNPLIDGETHRPYKFLDLPLVDRQLLSYQWNIDWMLGTDPYSALLISRHRTGLWKARYGQIKYPSGKYDLHKLDPRIVEMIERNEKWQEGEMSSFDAKARQNFQANYQMLQVWDLLGLYFCAQEPCDDHIDPIPMEFGGKGARMEMRAIGKHRVSFDPYPFDEVPLRVQLACKRLPDRQYESSEEFREVFFKAPNHVIEYELSPR
jgi:hypothetical protein